MSSEIKTTGIDHKKTKKFIDKVRADIKKHPVVKEMFKEYGVDLSEIDLFPICFAELEVSARTDHGIVYLNTSLIEEDGFDPDAINHYLVHEITHILQQTTGTKPTQGAEQGNYLDNESEIEGFQKQVEYLADTKSEEVAEEYVDQVLDHHDVQKGREKKKDELMDAIARKFEFKMFLET